MNKPLALEMESLSLHRGPVRGTWRGGSSAGDFKRKVRFCSIRGLRVFFFGAPSDILKVEVKVALRGLFSTAALRPIVLLPLK
jgi:hypothetical protein